MVEILCSSVLTLREPLRGISRLATPWLARGRFIAMMSDEGDCSDYGNTMGELEGINEVDKYTTEEHARWAAGEVTCLRCRFPIGARHLRHFVFP